MITHKAGRNFSPFRLLKENPISYNDELRHLKGCLLYYQNLITNHDKNVDDAAARITESKKKLAELLKNYDEAPAIVESYKKRIKMMDVKISMISSPVKIDPKLRELIKLRKRLQKLEESI